MRSTEHQNCLDKSLWEGKHIANDKDYKDCKQTVFRGDILRQNQMAKSNIKKLKNYLNSNYFQEVNLVPLILSVSLQLFNTFFNIIFFVKVSKTK